MMNDMNPPAAGHNNPPPYDADLLAKHMAAASELAAEAAPWIKKKVVDDVLEAQKVTDYVAKARTLYKDVEEARKAQKQPHLDAGKAVDAAFATAVAALTSVAESLKPILADWLKRVEAEKMAEAARQDAIARAAREEADRLAAQAEASGDAMAAAEAEARAKEAKKLEQGAARTAKAKTGVDSATGAGRKVSLRSQKSARIDSFNLVYRHFHEHPDVRAVLQRLADAAVRGGETVPGAELVIEQVAA